ncbi:MAG: DUF4327 family protein [Calothrix sp. FI2-JRJ7]|jgi:hypothetical protein|nr:DUF4327 family protein [Calothrix sp. FI2-JRJ7]
MASNYDLKVIQESAFSLVEKGYISRQQSIYNIFRYIPMREWFLVERELEDKDFQLDDRICDLIGDKRWDND